MEAWGMRSGKLGKGGSYREGHKLAGSPRQPTDFLSWSQGCKERRCEVWGTRSGKKRI